MQTVLRSSSKSIREHVQSPLWARIDSPRPSETQGQGRATFFEMYAIARLLNARPKRRQAHRAPNVRRALLGDSLVVQSVVLELFMKRVSIDP